ncbi:DUF5689 domain-containing protein [Luteirhabdus pelagi]|uniref:DUF5689 domain-containing protein n=1 Tax=Luteirhabdus pelagi TaxID=2792783 RepID=UPI001939EB2F|nr:DUF5689 domain-containing protein [Luteirhabdus pelagi]
MKKFNLYNLTILFLVAMVTFSCVQDDEFEVPDTNPVDVNIEGNEISIADVRDLQQQEETNNGEPILTFEGTNNYISGYVVSSDEAGNFFEELILQDSPENPTIGIRVVIDESPLFTRYELGRRVFVKLDGLTVGYDSGVLTLGINEEGGVGSIPAPLEEDFLVRSSEVAELVPTQKSVSSLSPSDVNTLVQVQNVQFSATALGKTLAAEPSDDFDGERLLESCSDGETLLFSTSTFADFKSVQVPEGSGTITGVYSLNFFGDTPIISINSIENLNLDGERCDVSQSLEITTTIGEIRDMYNGSTMVFAPGSETVFEGYVVSSDQAGNFFKNIFIQDSPVNPTAAIQILADDNDLFQAYPPGSKVIVRADGLYLGESFGVLSLGFPDGDFIGRIEQGQVGNYVINTGENATIVPTPAMVGANGLTIEVEDNGQTTEVPAPEGILVDVQSVQVVPGEVGQAYAFYAGTDSANRTVESCITDNTIILRNSGFADFASLPFPTGQGNIVAVNSEYNGTPQLVIRDENDVNLDGDRCDPIEGFFFEDFESYSDINGLEAAGWTNVNVSGGSTEWLIGSFDNNKYAQISGFNSGASEIDVWLVTPAINMDSTENENLTFDVQTNFDTGEILTLYYSTDFAGDPTTATWTQLNVNIPSGPSSGFGTFQNVGNVDVSNLSGDVYFGFFYEGSDPSDTTRYHVDNVSVFQQQ